MFKKKKVCQTEPLCYIKNVCHTESLCLRKNGQKWSKTVKKKKYFSETLLMKKLVPKMLENIINPQGLSGAGSPRHECLYCKGE